MSRLLFAGAAVLLAAAPTHGFAQGARRPAAAIADSLAARGDTAAALRMLDSAVRADRFDAEAWNRRGLILWSMAKAKRSAGVMPPETIKQLMAADTSLRMARLIARDSARYALDLGTFQLGSKFAITRFAATAAFRDATEATERVPTGAEVGAAAAAQLAGVYWRRYQVVAHRLQWEVGLGEPSASVLDAMSADPVVLYDFVQGRARPLDGRGTGYMGEADYAKAERMAHRALEAQPDDSVARRLLFALLAERERWEELAAHAARARRVSPAAPLPMLAHGLALHRLSRRRDAEAAFDAALRHLPAAERDRLTSLARVMRARGPRRGEPSDSARYASYTPEQRAWVDSVYWAVADPLALTPENEFRTEYLARVAFAEIVWTSEEMEVKGADSERGDVYIRYGPPGQRNTIPGGEIWRYPARLAFVFLANPMFGTARLGSFSSTRSELLRGEQPVSFASTPLARRVDSIPVQLARFRVHVSRVDSADVFVTGVIPVDSMLRGLDVRRTSIDVAFGVWTAEGARVAQQATRVPVVVSGDAVNLPRLRSWRQRLPMGELLYRVEAAQYDGLVGARGRGRVALAPAPAFGTSDLLVAGAAAPRPGFAPRRWTDLAIAPSAAVLDRGAPLALVWETYGLATDSLGSARYRVSVSVEQRRGGKLADIAARIVGGIAGGAGTSLAFDRSGASGDVSLDWLTLDLGDAKAGEYVVRVTIEDRVAAARTTVERGFRIR